MAQATIYPDQRTEILRQIGSPTLMSISGGRIVQLPDGIELPVSNGFHVQIRLRPSDTYTVTRVFRRAGKEFIHGERCEVYCDEVSNAAYYASCFRSHNAAEWVVAK